MNRPPSNWPDWPDWAVALRQSHPRLMAYNATLRQGAESRAPASLVIRVLAEENERQLQLLIHHAERNLSPVFIVKETTTPGDVDGEPAGRPG